MKRILGIFLLVLLVAGVAWTFWFLREKSRTRPVVFSTETAQVADIVKKTVATGAIVPRREVEIKPRVSGVIDLLHVEAGDTVKQGDPIARIQIIPDAASLNRAQSEVRAADIAFNNARVELERNQKLFDSGVIPEADLQRFRTEFELRQQEREAAGANLQIVKEGQTRGGGKTSNIVVTSTVDGMVIDVPVKVGYSVIESNTFSPGTTIAFIADMDDMIFDGHLDESEVGKVEQGMKLKIKIGALEGDQFDGTLEYVAPKGTELEGAIQFPIKAAIIRKPGVFIRAGYSANADVVLESRTQVLALREAVVQYDDKTPYVEVEIAPQVFERRDVKLGLSDGLMVELLGGVTKDDRIKVPANAGPATMAAPPAPA